MQHEPTGLPPLRRFSPQFSKEGNTTPSQPKGGRAITNAAYTVIDASSLNSFGKWRNPAQRDTAVYSACSAFSLSGWIAAQDTVQKQVHNLQLESMYNINEMDMRVRVNAVPRHLLSPIATCPSSFLTASSSPGIACKIRRSPQTVTDWTQALMKVFKPAFI